MKTSKSMLSVVCCWCLCLVMCSFSLAENPYTEKPVEEKPVITQNTATADKQALEEKRALDSYKKKELIKKQQLVAEKDAYYREIARNNSTQDILKASELISPTDAKLNAETLDRVEKTINEPAKASNPHPADKFNYYMDIKPNYQPGEIGRNPNTNPASDSRDTSIEVYFCTDYWASESTFNICDADGNCVWDPAYGAGWIGGGACHSEYITLADGDYTLSLMDSYGDGGLCAGVYEPGVGTFVDFSCMEGSQSDYAFTVGEVAADDGGYDDGGYGYDDGGYEDDGGSGCDGYEVGLTVGGGSWDSEITWDLSDGSTGAAGTFGFCLAEGDYTFNGYDSYGDGWNGATATFSYAADGAVIASFAVEGESGSWTFTVGGAPPVAGCTDPSAPNYNADAEVDDGTCEAYCGDGSGCGYYIDFGYTCEELVGYGYDCDACYAEGACPVAGCTDDTADNYNPDATTDDGTCTYSCASYTVDMADSWGDGWNGNILSIGDSDFTLTSGAAGQACYDGPADVAVSCDGGSYQSEVSWSISLDGEVVLSGGAPFTGCLGDCSTEVYGCTDPSAPEYNADATADDGSCFAACAGNSSWIGDGYCDGSNNNADCAFDGGDCCPGDCTDGAYSCETYGGDCFDCVNPDSADLAEGGQCAETEDPTCADTSCGDYVGGYTCGDLEYLYGFDCSVCIEEGACAEQSEGCWFDWTNYGAESCDAAWDQYGLSCADLEANYGWDCSGCGCPGDATADDGGDDAGDDGGDDTCDNMTVTMCDSYGDGWNGNTLVIGDASFSPESGNPCEEACYDGPVDVAVTCGGGSWQSEVSWTINDADGTELLAGGAPYEGCLGDCGTADDGGDDGGDDCADNAVNLTVDGGSWQSEVSWTFADAAGGAPSSTDFCLADGDYIFAMTDAYGDGWNGNVATFSDENGVFATATLDAGDYGEAVITVGGDPVVSGCTDPGAPEYNADATLDDGSCWAACAGNAGWIGDGYCDGSNNNEGCAFDGGDCCPGDCVDSTYECASWGGDCTTCMDPSSADLAEGGQCADYEITCADTDCGYYIEAGYSCEEIVYYGFDCSYCEDECAAQTTCDDPYAYNYGDAADCVYLPDGWDEEACPGSYAFDTWCDCGCGAYDTGCDDPDASLWQNCGEGFECEAGDAECSEIETLVWEDNITGLSVVGVTVEEPGDAEPYGVTATWDALLDGTSCEENNLVTCWDGSCVESEDLCPEDACEDCEFDWTNYGSACCDTAWGEYGIDCATLESNYGWDCAGCACPGDVAAECGNGSCDFGEDYMNCPEDCEAPSACDEAGGNEGWIGDGWCDAINNNEACGFDAGDCCPTDCYANVDAGCPDAGGCYTEGYDACGTCEDCMDTNSVDYGCSDTADDGGADDGGGTDLAAECAAAYGHYCGDDESNWTSYSPNGCVPSYYICDGWDDCVDASDEADCDGRSDSNGIADKGEKPVTIRTVGTPTVFANAETGEITYSDDYSNDNRAVSYTATYSCTDCDTEDWDGDGTADWTGTWTGIVGTEFTVYGFAEGTDVCVTVSGQSDVLGSTEDSDAVCDAAGGCADADADGICDDTDDCVGEYDECGECNGDGSSCACDLGDANGDDEVNVLDIVEIVGHILDGDDINVSCTDMNADGEVNVMDIIAIVNIILDGRVTSDATEAKLNIKDGSVSLDANGFVGAVQMTLSHDASFSIELTDKAMVADYKTNANSTTLIVVAPESSDLFKVSGDFSVEEVIVAANAYSEVAIAMPTELTLSQAYPNPFNPSTTMDVYVPADGVVKLSVYNVMGQMVDVIHSGSMSEGNHSITWNASDLTSGMYFVRAESTGGVAVQKVMLMK